MNEAKKFPIEGKAGLSDAQIQAHRDVLYMGYVKKTDEIKENLKSVDRSSANATSSAYRALKVEESFAFNGVVLHEFYFGSLGETGQQPGEKTLELINRDFGGFEKWREDLIACGKSARGWAVLAYSLYDGKLHNYLLDTHHFNVPAMMIPIVAFDVYEHAYFIDYATDRVNYLNDLLDHILWDRVEKRINWVSQIGKMDDDIIL